MQDYPESECNPLQVPKLTLDSETEVGWSKKKILSYKESTLLRVIFSVLSIREICL